MVSQLAGPVDVQDRLMCRTGLCDCVGVTLQRRGWVQLRIRSLEDLELRRATGEAIVVGRSHQPIPHLHWMS